MHETRHKVLVQDGIDLFGEDRVDAVRAASHRWHARGSEKNEGQQGKRAETCPGFGGDVGEPVKSARQVIY